MTTPQFPLPTTWFQLLGNTGNTLDGQPFTLNNPAAH